MLLDCICRDARIQKHERAADSLSVPGFLGLALDEPAPDHSTISRTRRRLDVDTHEAVFTWLLQRRADAGLVTTYEGP